MRPVIPTPSGRAAGNPAETDASAHTDLERELTGLPDTQSALGHALVTRSPAEIASGLARLSRSADPPDALSSFIDLARDRLQAISPQLRDALTGLAVFPSTFDREAARVVLSTTVPGSENTESVLADLVEADILLRLPGEGFPRFRLTGPFRAAALSLPRDAAVTGLEPAREALTRHWQRLVREFTADSFSPAQLGAFGRISDALPTLDAILETDRIADPGAVLEVFSGLWSYWARANASHFARHWITTLLRRYAGELESSQRFDARWTLGWLLLDTPDRGTVEDLLEDAAADVETVEQRAALAQLRGIYALYEDHLESARELLTESYAFHRDSGPPAIRFLDLSFLATAASALGDHRRAYEWCELALGLSDAHGERILRNYVTWAFAVSAWRDGDQHRAYVLALDGLEAAARVNDHHAAAICIEVLAWYESAHGDPRRAALLLGAAASFRLDLRLPTPYLGTAAAHRECVDRTIAALGPVDYRHRSGEGGALTLDEVARRIASSTPGAGADPGSADAPLSPRQREIADLIAEGLTNKEIAQRLLITVRTVETHIGHIFQKLDVVSRAQVAAWAVQQ